MLLYKFRDYKCFKYKSKAFYILINSPECLINLINMNFTKITLTI